MKICPRLLHLAFVVLHSQFVIAAEPAPLQPTIVEVDEEKHVAALTPQGWVGERLWHAMSGFHEGICPVQEKKDGPWGAIDMTGNLIVPLEYDSVGDCYGGLMPVRKGKAHGYLKADGSVALPLTEEWEDAGRFIHANLAPVKKGGLWGFIKPQGQFVIPPAYEDAAPFSEDSGTARVKKGGLWGWIDPTGKTVIPFTWFEAGGFRDGRAAVQRRKDGLWGFIDPKGKLAIPFRFKEIAGFSEGHADVNIDGKWVLIDTSGKVLESIKGDEVWKPARGLATIRIGKTYGLAKLDGSIAEPAKWKTIFHQDGSHTIVSPPSDDHPPQYAVRSKDGLFSPLFLAPVHDVSLITPRLVKMPSGSISKEKGQSFTIEAGMHLSSINSISCNQKGSHVITTSSDSVRFWSFETGQLDQLTLKHLGATSAAISSDGQLAALMCNRSIHLVDMSSLREQAVFSGGNESLDCVFTAAAFSPTGRVLALSWQVAGKQRLEVRGYGILLLDADSGRQIAEHVQYFGPVNALAWADDGHLLSISKDGALQRYAITQKPGGEVSLASELVTMPTPHGEVTCASLSHDRKALAVARNGNHEVEIYETSTLRLMKVLSFTGTGPTALAWQPDSSLCAAIGRGSDGGNPVIATWAKSSVAGADVIPSMRTIPSQGVITAMTALPGQKMLFSTSVPEWGKVDESRGLEIIGKCPVAQVARHRLRDGGFRTSADGSRFALELQSGKVFVFSTSDLKSSTCASFAEAPQDLLPPRALSSDFSITDWRDSTSPKIMGVPFPMDFGEGMTTARCLTFSPDDRTAYIGTDDGVVALTKERRWRWKQDLSSPVWAVAVSGNGELAMTIRDDGGVRWFDGWTGRELGLSFFLHADGHRWVAWTDTGHFVSSEGAADLIKWDEDAVSSDQLYNKFYRPDVVREVIAKGEPAYKVIARLGLSDEVGAVTKKLPMVKISGIESGALASTDTLNVTVEATNTGGGLRNISLFHNGKRIPQDGPGQQRGTAQSLSYTVTLQPGENELKAQAANDAETSSTPAIVHVKFNGVQASSTLHLFTIGLNRYQNPRYNLTYCAADADASAEAFAKRAGGLFAEVKTHNLRDDQATKIAISEKFAELARSAKPQDVFIFCYAGHGVMGEKPEGKPGDNEFYLIPHDITRMYGDPTMLAEKGVSRKDLEDWCAKVPARKQLMLLDTCQSGGLVDAFAMRGVAEEKAIAQLARATGTVVIASTGAEAYARESKDIGHGIFTQVLLDGIAAGKADADKDGKITVKEIDAYINEAVPELSKKLTNTPQYPTSYSRGQDFPIGIVK